MNNSWVRILSILFVATVGGCSENGEKSLPETESDALNSFIRSAPSQFIHLDDVEVREITVSQNDIIYDVNQEAEAGEPIIGTLSAFTYSAPSLYVYDNSSVAIYRISEDGGVEGPLTREGSGPGEHQLVRQIHANNHHIYATDGNNGRINRYSHDMITAESLEGYTYGRTDVNDELLASANQMNQGFAPREPRQGLISIHSVNSLDDTLSTIMPRIVPPGYQPNVYNSTMFSMNQQDEMAASYLPLPWLFLFDDDFNHTGTLFLETTVFNQIDTPPLKLEKPDGNRGVGGAIPLFQFTLLNNGDLLITMPGVVESIPTGGETSPFNPGYRITEHHLVHLVRGSDGRYDTSGVYTFKQENSGQELWVMELAVSENGNQFFGRNRDYLFRFELDG